MNDIFSRRNFLKSSGFGIGALALGSLAPEAVFAATKDSLKNNSDFDSFARSFMYHIPTRLYFGFGELDNLGKYRLPGKKACVVISGGGPCADTATLPAPKSSSIRLGCSMSSTTKSSPIRR